MSTPSREKILEIECLRAFAIIYTLVAHYRFIYVDPPEWVQWMDSKAAFHGGVDLFFVISGFVISKNLIPASRKLADLAAKVRFVSNFWVRRVYRLWPSSWLWAFIGLAVIAVTDRALLVANVYDVAAALLQVYNYHAYSCMHGAGVCSHYAVGVYWSLSLEEQFYIALPVVLVAAGARSKWLLVILLLLAVPAHSLFPTLGAFFRWEAFCIGVLLAWLYANEAVRGSVEEHLFKPLGRTAWLASYLMLGAIPLIGVGAIGAASYTLTAVAAGVLVALACLDRGYLGIPTFLKPPLVYLGARSYSIYLVHTAVFLVFKALAGRGWRDALPLGLQHIGWIAAATLVVLALSELNYRFVEQRFRHMGRPAAA